MEVDWHACQHHVYISLAMHLSKEMVHLLIYSLVQWHSQGQFAVTQSILLTTSVEYF